MSEAKDASSADRPRKSRATTPTSGSFTVARAQVQELASFAGYQVPSAPATDLLSDELLVDRVLAGEKQLYELLMRRSAARLYRILRGLLGDDATAEAVLQEAYVRAFDNLLGFERYSRFSTWLSWLAIHEGLVRLRRAPRERSAQAVARGERRRSGMEAIEAPPPSLSDQQLARLLEQAIDRLPSEFRIVFTLRALDEMPAIEVAENLGLSSEVVDTRLFRARLRLRRALLRRFEDAEARVYDLALSRSQHVVESVLGRLAITAG
jgi:RNA polymerase sigma-70 factor (ECF subfamily)